MSRSSLAAAQAGVASSTGIAPRRRSGATLVRRVAAAVIAGVLGIAASANTAQAELIVIPNASWEVPDVEDGFVDENIDSWISSSPDSVFTLNPAASDFTGAGDTGSTKGPLPGTADGFQTLYIATSSGFESATSQPLVISAVDGAYTFIVAVGDGKGDVPFNAFVEILADGVVVASTFRDDDQLPEDDFVDVSVSYLSEVAGQILTVRVGHSNSGATMFDNARFDADPVPEPAAASLLAIGAAGLLRRGRRRA